MPLNVGTKTLNKYKLGTQRWLDAFRITIQSYGPMAVRRSLVLASVVYHKFRQCQTHANIRLPCAVYLQFLIPILLLFIINFTSVKMQMSSPPNHSQVAII